jgi:hypothetical protein
VPLSIGRVLLYLADVPVLVGIEFLADLEAKVLHPLQRFTHLHGLRQAIQVLLLDPYVQRLGGVLGELGHAPHPLADRAGVLKDEFAVSLHAFSSLREATRREHCLTGSDGQASIRSPASSFPACTCCGSPSVPRRD